MSIFTIQGKRFEFDALDADQMERYEAAQKIIQKEGEKIAQEYADRTGIRLAELIRRQCHAIFDFFDAVLGEGSSHEIFGRKTNLNSCLDAVEEMTSGVISMQEAYNKRVESYSPDRLRHSKGQ